MNKDAALSVATILTSYYLDSPYPTAKELT